MQTARQLGVSPSDHHKDAEYRYSAYGEKASESEHFFSHCFLEFKQFLFEHCLHHQELHINARETSVDEGGKNA